MPEQTKEKKQMVTANVQVTFEIGKDEGIMSALERVRGFMEESKKLGSTSGHVKIGSKKFDL
jgi:hypothetical protein